ncbi:MAG: hypothetical protein E6I96_07465 [Chloroflexi bacterium]|nr:MAG: hypothetical protein E6I96_07465 [Chloroflexota bacterium]
MSSSRWRRRPIGGCPRSRSGSDGSSELGLYPWDALADDAGVAVDGSGFRGFSLYYIVSSTKRIDEVLDQATRAGGKLVKPAQNAQWGGYFGYFSDPDGHLWKVATVAM